MKPCYDINRQNGISIKHHHCVQINDERTTTLFHYFSNSPFSLCRLCNKLAFQPEVSEVGQQPLSARLRRQNSMFEANVHLNYLRLNNMRQMTQTICWRCHYSSDFINHSTIVFRCLETCCSDNNYAIHLSRQANRTQIHLRHSSKSRRE